VRRTAPAVGQAQKAHGVEMSPEAFQRRILPKPPPRKKAEEEPEAHGKKGFWRS